MPIATILPSAGASAQIAASVNPAETLLEIENRSGVDMFYRLGNPVSATDPALAGIRLPANGGYRCISGPGARMAVYLAHASGSNQELVWNRSSPPV
jgi:hypothetical protein